MRVALRPLAAFFGRRDIPVSSFPGRTGGWSSGSSCSFRGRTPPLPRRDQRRCHVRAALPRKGWTSNTAPSGEGPPRRPSGEGPGRCANSPRPRRRTLPRKDPLSAPTRHPAHQRQGRTLRPSFRGRTHYRPRDPSTEGPATPTPPSLPRKGFDWLANLFAAQLGFRQRLTRFSSPIHT